MPGGGANGGDGELLLSLNSYSHFFWTGQTAWAPGSPVAFDLDLPDSPNLLGIAFGLQGVLAWEESGSTYGLTTEGMLLSLGL